MTYFLVFTAVLATSLLSGVLGMGGGILLAGALAFLLPLSTALLLHAVTQLTANAYRAFLLRKHFQYRIITHYGVGMMCTLVLFSAISVQIEKPLFYLLLGIIALSSYWLPTNKLLDATKTSHAIAAGFSVSALHLFVGVAGPLLDMFFQKTTLNRFQIVATKAATQSLGHLLRIGFYLTVFDSAFNTISVQPETLVAIMLLACIGTYAGSKLLSKMSDAHFLTGSRLLLTILGVVFVGKGLNGLW
jgi:uncharacterized membrane protein YfcA